MNKLTIISPDNLTVESVSFEDDLLKVVNALNLLGKIDDNNLVRYKTFAIINPKNEKEILAKLEESGWKINDTMSITTTSYYTTINFFVPYGKIYE